jgi:hypothetical protein
MGYSNPPYRTNHIQSSSHSIIAKSNWIPLFYRRIYDTSPLEVGKSTCTLNSPKKSVASGDVLSSLQSLDSMYNITSNLLFFAGSVCYLMVSHWRASNLDQVHATKAGRISAIAVGGSIFYSLNASVGMALAIRRMRRNPRGSIRWRESVWSLASNLLFGMGAVMDTSDCLKLLLQGEDPSGADKHSLSAHLYFLSGLCICYELHFSCLRYHQLLIRMGDLLFLLGSVCDLIITYSTQYVKNSAEINRFWLVSSTLWLVNSILYLVADVLELISGLGPKKIRLRSSVANQICLGQPNPHTV